MVRKKGFTLIELLVVIAIIGILSSVVVSSLATARQKGGDAGIKSNLDNLRNQAEIIHDSNNCYADGIPGTCDPTGFAPGACASSTPGVLFADTKIAEQIFAAGNLSLPDGGMAAGSCVSSDGQNSWAIAVPLKNDPTQSWCVDSAGSSRSVTPSLGDLGFNGVACK